MRMGNVTSTITPRRSQRSRRPRMRRRMPRVRAILQRRARTATAPAARREGSPALAGQSKADLVQKMNEFRDGKRQATIMHQLAKGYTPEQIDLIAGWFAAAETLTIAAKETAMTMQRRDFLKAAAAPARARGASPAARRWAAASAGKVVVIGGGYGGATAAKYIRMWSEGRVDVTLVETERRFRVLPDVQPRARRQQDAGRHHRALRQLARRHGVRVVRDTATAVDRRSSSCASRAARSCRTTGSCSRRASTSCTKSVPGLNNAQAQEADPARLEGRTADGGAAPAARGHAATAACTR